LEWVRKGRRTLIVRGAAGARDAGLECACEGGGFADAGVVGLAAGGAAEGLDGAGELCWD